MKLKKSFSEDFPNVNDFIIGKLKSKKDWDQESTLILWNFCEIAMKSEDDYFSETRMLEFVKNVTKCHATYQTLMCYRLKLAAMYFLIHKKDFFFEFPKVDAVLYMHIREAEKRHEKLEAKKQLGIN